MASRERAWVDKCTRPTVDFDHHSAEHVRHWVEQFRVLRAECPVAWTEKHGGYWVVAGYEHLAQVARDHETFSSGRYRGPDGELCGGLSIPPGPLHLIPDELDPPEWTVYRRLLSPYFTPRAVEDLQPRLLAFTTEMLDRVIETGRFDIVLDLANPVTALITLEILGLPFEEWQRWAKPFHEGSYIFAGAPGYDEVIDGFRWVFDRLATHVAQQRRGPRTGLLGELVDARVDGRPLDDSRIIEIAMQILGGGVDTTTGLIANTLVHLHRDRSARRRLIEEPELRRLAGEEFVRYFAPVHATARNVTKEVVLGGQRLCPGQRVLISYGSANRDGDVFAEPDSVVLDRLPNRHVGFGIGIHRCLGSNLARTTFQVVLGQVLERIPDYEVLEEQATQYDSIGTINGWVTIPATFTPGPKIGSGLSLSV